MPPHTTARVATQPRVVLVTGASSGIGLCSAARFAARGWHVGLVSRSESRLAQAAALIAQRVPGARLAWAVADVTDSAALTAAARQIAASLGPLSCWVNAAGNGVYGHFADVSEAEFRRVTDVTYLGTVNGTRVALSHMRPRDQGSIVNVCSAVVFHGVPLMTSYSGAKAAVRAFGQSLRLELRLTRSHIRVSTLFPPAINTPFFDHAVSHMGFPARPVPPVYGPEVAAGGVYLCATGRGGERTLTGVVVLYSAIARVSLRLAGYLVSKSDFASHLPRDHAPGEPEAADRTMSPCLFQPGEAGCAIDGPFGERARGWSCQLRLMSGWQAGWQGLTDRFRSARLIRPDRPAAPLPPAHVPEAADRAPCGSSQRQPAASDSGR